MTNDFSGSFDRALPINPTQSLNNRLGKSNRVDMFRLTLTESVRLSLKGRSSGQGAQIQLIQDLNQNGRVDRNEVLKGFALRRGQAKQNSFSQDLAAGTYFVQVTGGRRGTTQYRLSLDSTPIAQGNTSQAVNLQTASTLQTASNLQTTSNLQSAPETTSSNEFADRVVALTNSFRQQNGLAPLANNSKLAAVAQSYSQTMATQDFVAHQGLDGSQPWDRMTAGGYKWSRAAENVAAGQQTPEEVMQDWINSPGHRANLLDPRLKEIGVGYYFLANDTGSVNYNYYWTQKFGAPG